MVLNYIVALFRRKISCEKSSNPASSPWVLKSPPRPQAYHNRMRLVGRTRQIALNGCAESEFARGEASTPATRLPATFEHSPQADPRALHGLGSAAEN